MENLDHLGTVAGLVDDLGLVKYLNEHVGVDLKQFVLNLVCWGRMSYRRFWS